MESELNVHFQRMMKDEVANLKQSTAEIQMFYHGY